MKPLFVALTALAVDASTAPAQGAPRNASQPAGSQTAVITYRLGTDTVAIEQYTRTANRIAGDMVQRGGGVVQRIQYELSMGPNGKPASALIKRMQADGKSLPNQPTETRFRITADSVVRENVFPDSVQRRAFAARGATVSFPVYVYGPYEYLAKVRADKGPADSMSAVGLAGNGVGFAGLAAVAGDTLMLRGAPYAMHVRFDNSGRLLLVDGSTTTNKMTGVRSNGPVDIAAIARAMKPTGALSTRETARGAFGAGGIVLVDYGRPMVRERTVWGGTLVPFDSVWRAGANDATHLFTTRTLTMGDVTLPPGMYTLWVKHSRTGTSLIVNKQTGQWGTVYDPAQDVGRVPMTMTATPNHVEQFTITVRGMGANRGALDFAWGGMTGTVPFTATVARP